MKSSISAFATKAHVNNQSDKQTINIDDVSPELAALIVKNFILPMFESDEKRYLKRKY
jgi:hypothetical protein